MWMVLLDGMWCLKVVVICLVRWCMVLWICDEVVVVLFFMVRNVLVMVMVILLLV